MVEYITQFDFQILDFIQANMRTDILDKIMVFLSMIGEGGIVWFVVALPMLFFKKTRVCGALMILSMGVTLLFGEFILKNIFCRVRPCNINFDVDMLVKRPSSYSFPSGHTSSSFTAATTVFVRNRKLGAFALLLAFLIAFSRLYNYVHYPTDVVAGALFGIFVSLLVYHLVKKFKIDNKIESLKLFRKKDC